MGKYAKLLARILSGQSDQNINFDQGRTLLDKLGFSERVKGDHHIFYKLDIKDIINIQPKGSKMKAYQVKQVRELIVKHKLSINE